MHNFYQNKILNSKCTKLTIINLDPKLIWKFILKKKYVYTDFASKQKYEDTISQVGWIEGVRPSNKVWNFRQNSTHTTYRNFCQNKFPATTTPWLVSMPKMSFPQNTKQDFQNPHPTFQSSREFQG